MVYESVCTKCQVCIVSVWPGVPGKTNKPTYVQVKIGISLTGCSPQVDFDIAY